MKSHSSKPILLLILCSLLVFVPRINIVEASATVYIRATGLVDPPTAPIHRDGDRYTFTGNINQRVEVQKGNIIIDGNGYTLQGTGVDFGFYLSAINNVTIQNTNITNFDFGVYVSESSGIIVAGNNMTSNTYGVGLWDSSGIIVSENNMEDNTYGVRLASSSFNTIFGNKITKNNYGMAFDATSNNNTVSGNSVTKNNFAVHFFFTSFNTVFGNTIANNSNGVYFTFSFNNTLWSNTIANNTNGLYFYSSSDNNTVSGNTITNNFNGIYIYNSSDNRIHQNNFLNNTKHVYFRFSGYANVFDDGYPSGGNYWSNYTGVDFSSGTYQNITGRDGLGDTPHVIDANNTDHYPLIGRFSRVNPSPGYYVSVISNSTIEDFEFFEVNSTIMMRVSNASLAQSFGFCRVSIPKGLMFPPYTITIDNGLTEVLNLNDTLFDNGTHRWIYFAYPHSIHEVMIQGFIPPDTTPPTISVLSPQNKTYPSKNVPLTFTISEPASWIGYSLDNQMNVTISGNTTIIGLSEGAHTITIYANDTAGNMGRSAAVSFTVDTVPPSIVILSPENTTYTTSSVPLNFILSEAVWWIGYSLDGRVNVTVVGNTTMSGLSNGSHSLIIYAKDSVANTGFSEKIYFSVNAPTPEPQQAVPFPYLWIAAAIVIIAVIGVAILIYSRKGKKEVIKI